MNKEKLRTIYLKKRKELTEADFQQRNLQIAQLFFETFNLSEIETVHSFLPITKNKEIDTWQILDRINQAHPQTKIILTRTLIESKEMQNFLYTPQTVIAENKWGIPEPEGAEEFHGYGIDLVITPLIIFDKLGNRVGYGKGFYDRFFSKCDPECIKVGLCLEPPVDVIGDCHELDIKMDFCITPDKVYKF